MSDSLTISAVRVCCSGRMNRDHAKENLKLLSKPGKVCWLDGQDENALGEGYCGDKENN